VSAALERRLARLERANGPPEEDDDPVFYCLRDGDPYPDLSGRTKAVFVMRLQEASASTEGPPVPPTAAAPSRGP